MISKNFNFLKVLSKSKYEIKKMNSYNNFKKFAFTPLKIENKKNSKEEYNALQWFDLNYCT